MSFLYISTSVGATVHVHYCMGKLAGWEIGIVDSATCGKCGMQKSSQKNQGCCNDETKLIQNNADQQLSVSSFQITQFTTAAIPVLFFELPPVKIFSTTLNRHGNHSPPESAAVAVYIRNCVFLI